MLRRLSLGFLLVVCLALSPRVLAHPSLSQEALLGQSFPAPPVRARAAIVVDADTGKVLAGVNMHLRLPMASTTKLMTALLALQLGKLTDRIRVPAAAFDFESDATIMGLHAGQVVTLQDLLYGLLLPSGADAANTIAIHYAGSEAAFVARMNREAQVLGMRDTHYADATGLTSYHHYTSAYDLALLGRYMAAMPVVTRITATRYYHWNGHTLVNVNHILFWYPGVDGLKPGYTDDAGICQVIDARRDGRHVVVALLNTPDLVVDARNLLNFGLRDFTWIQSSLSGDGPGLVQSGLDGRGRFLYFPAAGHYLHGAFLGAFQADGGLSTLGYPRTEPLREGKLMVQYFQNAALALDANGKVWREPLGTAPEPTPTPPPPTARPSATPSVTPTPGESVIVPIGSVTPTPSTTTTPTVTPTPRPHLTRTPTPLPTPRPTATRTAAAGKSAAIAAPFAGFQKAHSALLGRAVSTLHWIKGYGVQVFAYGALVTDSRTHAVYLLPLGDHFLGARHFLPAHPGNVYPPGFAPRSLLNTIRWLTG
jgi:D-alanyl-D-alanine carboxypeptidase